MLARYRLQSPYQYVLKIVQALVATGTGEIHLSCGNSRIRIRCPGMLSTYNEWQRFLTDRGEEGEGARGLFQDLEVALNAVEGLEPSFVQISCVGRREGEGFRYEFTPKGEQLSRLRVSKGEQTEIVVRRNFASYGRQQFSPLWSNLREVSNRDLFDLYAELKSNRDSEYSQVWRRCCFAPIPIFLNRIAVNRPVFGKPKSRAVVQRQSRELQLVPAAAGSSSAKMISVLSTRDDADVIPVLGSYIGGRKGLKRTKFWFSGEKFPHSSPHPMKGKYTTAGFLVERSKPERSWGRLGLKLVQTPYLRGECLMGHSSKLLGRAPSWVCFVKNGVVIEKLPGEEFGLEGWTVVVSAAQLQTDLTGFQLLRDHNFESLIRCLQELAQSV